MKAVLQRVHNASVMVDDKVTGAIQKGILVYLGVAADDTENDALKLAEKISHIRIFEDAEGKMNLSLTDIVQQETAQAAKDETKVGVLAVSQFTLLADTRRGRRPFFGVAAESEKANTLYQYFMEEVKKQGLVCEAGIFQAHMKVTYTNDGPVTILLDSHE